MAKQDGGYLVSAEDDKAFQEVVDSMISDAKLAISRVFPDPNDCKDIDWIIKGDGYQGNPKDKIEIVKRADMTMEFLDELRETSPIKALSRGVNK